MRHARLIVTIAVLVAVAALAQQPIGVGPDNSAGLAAGIIKVLNWYNATASGCSASPAQGCVGHAPLGDTYYFTAWLANSNNLPVTNGLPIVGTLNDGKAPLCSTDGVNIAVIQLDTFDWNNPNASRITKINCMAGYGTSVGATGAPAGWYNHCVSGDAAGYGGSPCGWKSRVPFAKDGKLYLPVERQIGSGAPSIHDATMIVSADGGKTWKNPYTLAYGGGADANGDAPLCGAASLASGAMCLDESYTDSAHSGAHSNMMWKGLPLGTENWEWVNWGNQDGSPYPPGAGVKDGCDPNVYTCFMLLSYGGQVARVPNASIMDVAAWQYYTCPALTQNYQCPGSDPANWTSDFSNATKVLYLTYSGGPYNASGEWPNAYSILYVKEFGSYITFGQGTDISWAPSLMGPWKTIWRNQGVGIEYNFLCPVPALGYKVVSSNPPHIQLTSNSNSYLGGYGSPFFVLWDLVAGKNLSSSAYQSTNLSTRTAGAGYQFTTGNVAGSFPGRGLRWSFDLLEGQGASWPFFMDRGNYSAVLTACDGGTNWNAMTNCGTGQNAGHGTGVSPVGLWEGYTAGNYLAHWQVAPSSTRLGVAATPTWMLGNSSYSVVGVYDLTGITSFGQYGNIWSTGQSGADNAQSLVSLDQVNGTLALNWNVRAAKHWQWPSNFTLAQGNWYYIAVTVQARTGCGSNCVPDAHIWVGNAGAVSDVLAGQSYTGVGASPTTKTPNVAAGPFALGMSPDGVYTQSAMSYATVITYDRPLTGNEVQFMYRSMKTKMAARGIALQ